MDTLDVVIIVCVVIGALALCFVFYILYWAWQYDRRNRDQYRADKNDPNVTPEVAAVGANGVDDSVSSFGAPNGTDGPKNTASMKTPTKSRTNKNTNDTDKMAYPSEIGLDDSLYPESVMSEDINASLRYNSEHLGGTLGSSPAHEGGSVSSMDVESYGYSIEAPSLATNTIAGDTVSAAPPPVKSTDSLLSSSQPGGGTK